jgi:hypothetical protein
MALQVTGDGSVANWDFFGAFRTQEAVMVRWKGPRKSGNHFHL